MENICPICLEGNNTIATLCSCKTFYHITCWNRWVIQKHSCPTCRNIGIMYVIDNNIHYETFHRKLNGIWAVLLLIILLIYIYSIIY